MDFISNKSPQIEAMLKSIGLQSVEELFSIIPSTLKQGPITVDDGVSEYEGLRLMESIASKNTFSSFDHYLGGGAYEHHIPALVSAICSKSEFLTSYTPYQAEASQGMLQAIFEFQSSICALTGMDVSNASAYDGASACAEALLMALRYRKERRKVLIAQSLNPRYKAVVETYLHSLDYEIAYIPHTSSGLLDMDFLSKTLSGGNVAAILLQNPNFFGVLDQVSLSFALAKKVEAVAILCADLLVYGALPSARELGADIAVGDCQSLGLPLEFGGPYAGYMACRSEIMRQLPGRIVGETVDTKGQRGFVLTLQAREQHIRREKATSNICTNQALAALASLVAILWYGKEGMKELALMNFQKANYLKKNLQVMKSLVIHEVPTFNEFVIHFNHPIEKVLSHFRLHGIEPGIPLENQALLVAVTETKSLQQLNHYIKTAQLL